MPQRPRPTLSDMVLSRTLRDPATGDAIISPARMIGERVMIVPPNGRVLVCDVHSMNIDMSYDDFPTITVSGRIVSHTTVDGVMAESVGLEYAPMPVKRKRNIEEV